MFGVLAFALVAGIMFGVAEGASVATLLPTTFGGAYVTGNLDFYYMFEQSICLQNQGSFSTAFPNRGSSSITLVPYSNDVTPAWTCPTATKGPNTFVNSRNGIKLSDATGSSSKSSCVATSSAIGSTIANSMISNGFSIELWYHNFDTSVTEYTESDHVLFEIANASYSGPAQCGLHYSVRLAYSSASQQVVLRVDDDQNPGGCPLPITAVLSNADFQGLHHLAITYLATGPSSGTRTVNFYHDGVSIGSSVASTNATADINSAYSLILGCSTDSIKAEAEGEFNAFALHSTALSPGNISTNFEAFLPNSHPVVADVEIDHLEDDSTDINFTNMYYDFDEEQGKDSEQSITLIVSSLPPRGVLSDDITITVEVADLPDYAATGTLHYNQTIQNEFTGTDQFDFKISDGGAGFGISDTATITLNFQPTNDAPVAIAENYTVPEAKERELVLSGTDIPDQGSLGIHQPTDIEITSATTLVYGRLRLKTGGNACDGGTIINSFPHTITAVNESNVWTARICYEAFQTNDNDTASEDGVVGVDKVVHTIVDGSAAVSDPVDNFVTVTSVLNVGCDEFGSLSCMEIMTEDTELLFELKGTDSACDDRFPEPSGCDLREKKFVIFGLPEHGTLFANKSGGGDPEPITQEEVSTGDGFETLDPFIRYVPDPNYFNMGLYLPCFDNAPNPGIIGNSACADRFLTSSTYTHHPCAPVPSVTFGQPPYSLCGYTPAKYTTRSMHGQNITSLGFCSASVEEGCPAKIFYRLKIGQVVSPLNIAQATPGHIIWVLNQESNDEVTILSEDDYDGFEQDKFALIRGKNSGKPMRLTGVTQDVTNIQISIDDNVGEDSAYALSASAGSEIPNIIGKDFLFEDNCIFQGCRNSSFEVWGIESKLNYVLSELRFQYNGDVPKNKQVKVATFLTTSDPYVNKLSLQNNVEPYVFNMLIGETVTDSACGLICDLKFIAIASSAGILILMCLISYLNSAGHCCVNRARAFGNVAEVINRKDPFVVQKRTGDRLEHEIEAQIHHTAREVKKAGFFLWILACLCPCCCTYDRQSVNNAADEHNIAREVAHDLSDKLASERLPGGDYAHERNYDVSDPEHIFNWEKHTIVKNGKQVAYYYNSVTDKSQWHSPFPGQNIRAAGTAPHAPSSRAPGNGGRSRGSAGNGGETSAVRYQPRPPPMKRTNGAGGNNSSSSSRRYQPKPPPKSRMNRNPRDPLPHHYI
eukprot:CAMPEP_0204862682 /NCGR_PEP_ID=MMETSP1348-20121228/2728_1 /ASSEMBLY_ACC=CAM_ASM_000700 /TAXON_ID=215587 /ORGANISM="Aplanochytrium stocchinoi, Strain GSBS06" /LENGTH=1218 /DNA_ID=CAMNT_0052012757 /DNA_START=153 /DNA_END=3809 /DNA_ORIENTATION=+